MKERSTRIFLEPQKISRHLHCSICHQVFDYPVRMNCGHTFCYVCIQQWAAMSKNCPLCKKSLRNRKPQKDFIAGNLIDQFLSKCSHTNCKWTGVYSVLKKHQRVCQHRERKAYDQNNFDNIVRLSDDQQMDEILEVNKKGKKKLKRSEDENEMPTFPSSSQQQSSSFNIIQPLKPNTRSQRRNNSASQANIQNQARIEQNQILSEVNNSKRSQQSDGPYLEVNLSQLIPNKNKKKKSKNSHKMNNQQNGNLYIYEEDKSQNIKNRQNDNDQQENGYLISSNFQKKRKQGIQNNYIELNSNQPQFFNYLDIPDNPGNLYLLQKQKQLQRQKQQKPKLTILKWGKVHPQSSVSKKSQNNSSDEQNPFDQDIPQKKQRIDNQIIVLDSSDQSNMNRSKQSGQLSQHLNYVNPQMHQYEFIAVKGNKVQFCNGSMIEKKQNKQKEQISRQIQELTCYRPQRQYYQRQQKRDKGK